MCDPIGKHPLPPFLLLRSYCRFVDHFLVRQEVCHLLIDTLTLVCLHLSWEGIVADEHEFYWIFLLF